MKFPQVEDVKLLSEGLAKFRDVFERNGVPVVLFAYTPLAPAGPYGVPSNACQLLVSHATPRDLAAASLAFGATTAKSIGYDPGSISLENPPAQA